MMPDPDPALDIYPYGVRPWHGDGPATEVMDRRDGHIVCTCVNLPIAVTVADALNDEHRRLNPPTTNEVNR